MLAAAARRAMCEAVYVGRFRHAREDIRRTALGCAERGVEADGPFDYATGHLVRKPTS